MEASTQYNDLKGTVAADISDLYSSLNDYLKENYKKFNNEQYSCKGYNIHFGYDEFASIEFICYDNKSGKYVALSSSKETTASEILKLFKRFNIVIGNSEINDIDHDLGKEEPIYLD